MSFIKKIEEEMTEYPSIATDRMSVSAAAEFMKKNGVRHLPVVKDGKVLGVISERDLKQAEILADAMTLYVSDIMTKDPYCVKIGTPLANVAREMARKKYGCTVVLNNLERVVGIFTTTDGMRVLSQLLDAKEGAQLRVVGIESWLTRNFGVAS